MTRMAYLDPPGEIADKIRSRRGGLLRPLDHVLLYNPHIALGWNELLGAVRERSSLSGDVREAVILVVARINDASYEWDAHAPIALQAGMTPEQVEWIRAGEGPSNLSETQQVAVDFAEALTRDCKVSDELFERSRGQLGDQGVVELALTTGAYNMVSRFLNAMSIV